MSLTYTGRVRRMDEVNRIAIPKQICETLGYEAGAPFEFYIDNGEGAVIIRPYDPNAEAMYHGNSNNVRVWINAQIEAFAAFGYILEVITPEGKRVGTYDYDIPTPSEDAFENAFTYWKRTGSSYHCPGAPNGRLYLYPVVDNDKPFLWIISNAPDTAIMGLAGTYMDKFVN